MHRWSPRTGEKMEVTPVTPQQRPRAVPGTLLVIDDDPDFRNTITKLLVQEGYAVTLARDGHTALERLEHMPPPDAILLDLYMPGMDGFDFVRALRAKPEWEHVPLVLITAANERQRAPIDAFAAIRKPIEMHELFSTIERACASRAS
jgi:CheY-like chemotaxis protein